MRVTRKFKLFLMVFAIACSATFAQNKIVGRVVDAEFQDQGIPYASIKVESVEELKTFYTDLEGNFSFELPTAKIKQITVNTTGYLSQKLKLKKNATAYTIFLKENTQLMKTLEIKEKRAENPALRIIRNIAAQRKKYHTQPFNGSYQTDEKIEVGIGNVSRKFFDNQLLRPFAFAFDYADTLENIEFVSPLLLEKITLNNFVDGEKKVTVLGKKKSMFHNIDIEEFIRNFTGDVELQSNFVVLGNKNFISPFHETAWLYYHFNIRDSLMEGEEVRQYTIDFFPKNESDLAFKGFFVVDNNTYFVHQAAMKITDAANLNYIRSMEIEVEYQWINDEIFQRKAETITTIFDLLPSYFGLNKKNVIINFVGKKIQYHTPIQFEPRSIPPPTFEDNVKGLFDKGKKIPNDLDSLRSQPLSEKELGMYELSSRVEQTKRYNQIRTAINFIGTGYLQVGKVEIGDLWSFYQYNRIEKHRFSLSIRNNLFFSDQFSIQATVGYGLYDQAWKYSLSGVFLVDKSKWSYFQVNFERDLRPLQSPRQFNYAFTNGMESFLAFNDVLGSFLIRSSSYTSSPYAFLQTFQLGYGRDIGRDFVANLSVINRYISPRGDLEWRSINNPHEIRPAIQNLSVNFTLHYMHEPVYVVNFFTRVLAKKYIYPLVSLYFEAGIPYLTGQYSYQKLELKYQQHLLAGPIGESTIKLSGGMIFGAAPYPLMFTPKANNTYIYNPEQFHLMNVGEFVASRYVDFGFEHNFNGFFLGKIPWIKKLKMREVVGVRGIFGALPYQYDFTPNISFNRFDPKIPYIEWHVGLDNILQFFRVDVFFRSTYLDLPNASKVGVRASLSINF